MQSEKSPASLKSPLGHLLRGWRQNPQQKDGRKGGEVREKARKSSNERALTPNPRHSIVRSCVPGKLPWEPMRLQDTTRGLSKRNGTPETLLWGVKPDTSVVFPFILPRFLDGCPRPAHLQKHMWTKVTITSQDLPEPRRI